MVFGRRATMGPMSPIHEADESTHLVHDSEAGHSGSPSVKRRQTFTHGEQFFPTKNATWVIEDSEESMGDAAIVINLLADLSPAGILPLSFGMIGTGYIPSVILLVIFATAAAYMMYLVGKTMSITRLSSYPEMWSEYVGESTAWVPSFVVFSVCFGCCLAYACMFGDLFAGCMPAFGLTFASRTVCLITLAVFPLLPLCFLKDLSALAPTSFGALAAVIYTIIVMFKRYADGSYAEGGLYFTEAPPEAGDHIMTFGPKSLLLVNGLAVAFLCHYNGCKYYREFVGHTPGTFGSKVSLSFASVSLIFAVAMIAGYATFGGNSEGVILNSYAANDLLANIARVGMGLANVFSFPLMFSGLREQAISLIVFFMPDQEPTTELVVFQNSLSAVMLVIITMVAVLVTDASIVVGLVGSICGSATIYIIPCILFDRCMCSLTDTQKDNAIYGTMQKILVRTIGVTGCFLMVAGAVATLAF